MEEDKTVVFDNGSGTIKVGFAGDEVPRAVFPSAVGHRTIRVESYLSGHKDSFVGNEAFSSRLALAINRPIERGILNNWTDIVDLAPRLLQWNPRQSWTVDDFTHRAAVESQTEPRKNGANYVRVNQRARAVHR